MAKKSKINDLNILEDLLKDNVLALALLDKVKFMEKTLMQLQEEITEKGVVTEMSQGSYTIERANPRFTSIQRND